MIGVLSLLIAAIMLSVGNEVERPSSGITGEEQLSVTTEVRIVHRRFFGNFEDSRPKKLKREKNSSKTLKNSIIC